MSIRGSRQHARCLRKRGRFALILDLVIEIGRRARSQPAPPEIVFEALADPDRDPARPWLTLLEDEHRPRVVEAVSPSLIVWSSIWVKRPDALLRFDLPRSTDGGTQLLWTLHADEPLPDAGAIGHMRQRVNELINANLRYTFGQ
jgi:hypothetical protein